MKMRIVVLGAGFGGLAFAQKFRHPEAEVTVIERQNHHLFQPLLYQVATAGLAMPDVAEPVRTILQKRDDISVIMAEVRRIEVEERRIHLEGGKVVDYDYLVVGLGMVNSYFGHDEWAQHSIGVKSLDDARRIRRRILHAYERAEASDDAAERNAYDLGRGRWRTDRRGNGRRDQRAHKTGIHQRLSVDSTRRITSRAGRSG